MKGKSESEVAQSCLTLSDHMDCSPPGSPIPGILQARVLEWVAIAVVTYIILNVLVATVLLCVASLAAQMVKSLPARQENWVRSLSQEDPLEKEIAIHSSILAWKIPWTEEPGRLQSMVSQ